MPGAPTPPTLLEAIASDAGPSYITDPIPDAPTGTNAASVQQGFPPITMTNEQAGGEPPLGQDVNGFLFLISSHSMYVQCGQLYPYNSALATAIGGYLAGSILGMADGTGIWMCITNGNTSNPDTGGAGWVAIASYGKASVPVVTGVVTLTPAQYRRDVIQFTGTLTGNVTVELPNIVGEWLLVNSTSGAFTLTATAGGSGVTIPQGGFATPTGVYTVGNTNAYPTVTPLSVAIDQNPTPLTLVERTSAGYVTATYFNQNSAIDSGLPIGAVFCQYNNNDGYLRKIALTNFESQLLLQAMGGQVTNGQVPFSVVSQWASALFASAALTGTPTAPTAGVGASSTQIATTAFANPGANLGQGYATLPSGMIIQGGQAAISGTTTVTFNKPFPNTCLAVVFTNINSTNQIYLQSGSPTRTGFTATNGTATVNWIAIGY